MMHRWRTETSIANKRRTLERDTEEAERAAHQNNMKELYIDSYATKMDAPRNQPQEFRGSA